MRSIRKGCTVKRVWISSVGLAVVAGFFAIQQLREAVIVEGNVVCGSAINVLLGRTFPGGEDDPPGGDALDAACRSAAEPSLWLGAILILAALASIAVAFVVRRREAAR